MTPPFTVKLEAVSELALEEWAVGFLRERNWSVERPHDWETPRELCTRLEINIQTWIRRTKYRQCPAFEVIRGKLGRRSFVRSTPKLEKFLTNGKR